MKQLVEYSETERYMFVDLASKKKSSTLKKQQSRQAISVIAVTYPFSSDSPYIFSVYAWSGKLPASKLRDKIISVYDDFKPRICGIEANGMQELYGDLVREEAKEKLKQKLRMVPIYQPTKIDKYFRIRTIIDPVLDDGRLFIPDNQLELRAEIAGFPTARTEDLIDALATAIRLVPKTASKKRETESLRAYMRYMEDRGVPKEERERRIKDLTNDAKYDVMNNDVVPVATVGKR